MAAGDRLLDFAMRGMRAQAAVDAVLQKSGGGPTAAPEPRAPVSEAGAGHSSPAEQETNDG